MKRPLLALSLFTLLSTTAAVCWTTPAHAGNSSVEATIQSYGDLSMFYQALLNTGVINEMNENEHYTIFAPTNAAFIQIRRDTYPCFYAVECRPQIAALMRNHIIVGYYDLPTLVTYGQGIQTGGGRVVHVSEPFVGDYAVDGQKILSKSEVAGNIIYRIDGVLAYPQDLATFQTVSYAPAAGTVTTEKTTVRKTYHTLAPPAYPAGTMVAPSGLPENTSQTTTVTHTYTEQ